MKIKEKIDGSVAILTLSGKMMGGPETQSVHDHIKGLISDGIINVVIDLGDVKWMNSSGLGSLMAGLTTLRGSGGDLKLVHVPDRVKRPIEITKLDQVIKMYESLDEAVTSFEEGE